MFALIPSKRGEGFGEEKKKTRLQQLPLSPSTNKVFRKSACPYHSMMGRVQGEEREPAPSPFFFSLNDFERCWQIVKHVFEMNDLIYVIYKR